MCRFNHYTTNIICKILLYMFGIFLNTKQYGLFVKKKKKKKANVRKASPLGCRGTFVKGIASSDNDI
jgi:hypothetical protein